MRILFLWEGLNIGGAERYLVGKVKWLRDHGHQVWVASSGGELEGDVEKSGAKHQLVPSVAQGLGINMDFTGLMSVYDTVLDNDIQIIDTIAMKPFIYGEWIRAQCGVRHIFEALSPAYVLPSECRHLVEPLFLNGNVATMERSWVEPYERMGIDVSRTKVIPHSVDTEVFRPGNRDVFRRARGLGRYDKLVLTVSRLDYDKARYIERLISEFAEVRKIEPRASLLIVGNGTAAERIEHLAARSGYAARVSGTSSQQELAFYYSAADVYVGMGATVLEAAACGAPVVVANHFFLTVDHQPDADSAACGLFGADGYEGIAEPGEKMSCFAKPILRLLSMPRLRDRIGGQGWTLARQKFSREAVMQQWEDYYRGPVRQQPPTETSSSSSRGQ